MDQGRTEGEARAPASSPRAIARLLGIFDAIAARPEGMTLAELTLALDAPKSSLLALLRPLTGSGHLDHANGRYVLGREIFRLASDIVASRKFGAIMQGAMEKLAEESGETVILAAIDRALGIATYVHVIESKKFVRYAVPAGVVRPVYCSAGGCVLLAYQTREWREAYLAKTRLTPLTPRTITDPDELRRKLVEIRREGCCVSVGEAVSEAAGVAAPIFDSDGSVSAALVIGAPAERADRNVPAWSRMVMKAASEASRALGYRAPARAIGEDAAGEAVEAPPRGARPRRRTA